MTSCGGLVITPDTVAGVIATEDTAVEITKTGNMSALSITAGAVTCCGETVARVGVKYNAQSLHDGSIQYNATVN